MSSLLENCLEKISRNPAREGILFGLPPYLTDRILKLVMLKDNKAILALRLWSSLGLPVCSVYIRDSLVDDRILSSLNTFKATLQHILFERCEFEARYKRSLELNQVISISIINCYNLTERILSGVFGCVLGVATSVRITRSPGLQEPSDSLIRKSKRLKECIIDDVDMIGRFNCFNNQLIN
jgi:hypothetical protein